MLFISRFIGPDQYGVVDTDDGVEQVVDFSELYSAVCVDGLEIMGARKKDSSMSEASVMIAQPKETVSRMQTKAKILLNVDIKVYKNMITSIRWKRTDDDDLVDIRLSDFGTHVADYVLARNIAFGGCYKVCLVLDNKLTYSPNAFCRRFFEHDIIGKNGIGVIFDLRELSDLNAMQVYKMLYTGKESEMSGGILDKTVRMDKVARMRYKKDTFAIKRSFDEFSKALMEGIDSALY